MGADELSKDRAVAEQLFGKCTNHISARGGFKADVKKLEKLFEGPYAARPHHSVMLKPF